MASPKPATKSGRTLRFTVTTRSKLDSEGVVVEMQFSQLVETLRHVSQEGRRGGISGAVFSETQAAAISIAIVDYAVADAQEALRSVRKFEHIWWHDEQLDRLRILIPLSADVAGRRGYEKVVHTLDRLALANMAAARGERVAALPHKGVSVHYEGGEVFDVNAPLPPAHPGSKTMGRRLAWHANQAQHAAAKRTERSPGRQA